MIDDGGLTVRALLEAYGSGELKPSDVVSECLDRIVAVDSAVGAFLSVEAESAIRQASESDQRWFQGDARPLEGVPYGLKDIIATEGVRTTGGSLLYGDFVPAGSGTVTSRLEESGAIRMGKLQTFEFACGANDATKNPWNLEYWPGGSSSGSAAAVAAGEIAFSIGTDTGGSVVIPASMCGIAGHKPTYGRIPRTGVMPLSWTLDHVGVLARTAHDVAPVLEAVSGPDGKDPTALEQLFVDTSEPREGLAGIRIGVPKRWFLEDCHPDVETATRAAMDSLSELGASVVEVDLPVLGVVDPLAVERVIITAEAAALHATNWDRLDEYGEEFARLLTRSQFTLAVDYVQALRSRPLLQRGFEAAFNEVDVLAVPTLPYLTPRLNRLTADVGSREVPLADVVAKNTSIFDLVGVPTTTVRVGFDRNGLPIGIQIAAPPLRESVSLGLAFALEQISGVPPLLPDLAATAGAVSRLPISPSEPVLELPVRNKSADTLW